MVQSMSFSGYFNFKNILLKLIHSWKEAFGVDKKRFARSNVVLKVTVCICHQHGFGSGGEALCLSSFCIHTFRGGDQFS